MIEMSLKGINLLICGVLMLVLLLSSPLVNAASQTFAYMNITGGWNPSGENITILENNWVVLQGGVELTIPRLTFVYNGFSRTSYVKDGRSINITINVDQNTDHKVEYPYTTHKFFYNDSTIAISFNTSLSTTAYYYISETYPTEVKTIGEAIVNGNTSPFRDLFFNHSTYNGMVDLSAETISINIPQAGDYILIVTDNPVNESDFEIISSTLIEVLEYKSELTASSIYQNDPLKVVMNLTAPLAEYRYGGALIKKEVYEREREIKLRSNKTKSTTNLTIDGVSLIENWKIAGVGLSNVNAGKAKEIIDNTIGANNGTIAFNNPINSLSQEIRFTTADLPTGTYILSVGVWQGSNRLVAFNQTEINIAAPTPTPTPTPTHTPAPRGGGGGGGGGGAAKTIPNIPIDPATGAVTSTTTLTGDRATLTIPVGTVVKDAEGNPVTTITIVQTATIAEEVGAIAAYDFGPSGATFEPPIDLVITFDPADIPAGFSESDLVIRMWDGTAWVELETTVNTATHTATAKVSHFTIFALFAAPPVEPAPTPTLVATPTPTGNSYFIAIATRPPVLPKNVLVVAAVIIVAVAYTVLRRRRRRGRGEERIADEFIKEIKPGIK